LVALPGERNDAVGVVRMLIRKKREDKHSGKFQERDGDRAYAILDVEPHDPSKGKVLASALALAVKNDIHVLLSNPSFEYWLLCHATSDPASLRCVYRCPKDADRELQKVFGHGKADLNRKPELFERLIEHASEAVDRATEVHTRHHAGIEDIRQANACTTVYKLVECLIGRSRDWP
jgi:hypothetical protein